MEFCSGGHRAGWTFDSGLNFWVCGQCRCPSYGVRDSFLLECDVCDTLYTTKRYNPDLLICPECEEANK